MERLEDIPLTDAVIEAYRPGIDRTLLVELLKLTPEERLRRAEELQASAEELRRGMVETSRS